MKNDAESASSTGSGDSIIETVRQMKCKMESRRRLMGHSARIFDTAFSPTYVRVVFRVSLSALTRSSTKQVNRWTTTSCNGVRGFKCKSMECRCIILHVCQGASIERVAQETERGGGNASMFVVSEQAWSFGRG